MNLTAIAEEETEAVLCKLPEDLQEAARDCHVNLEPFQDEEEDDLLGLFEGLDRMSAPSPHPDDWPRITLFLENLWEESGRNERAFREEVRVTYLHELGHYLGLDEGAVAALGLR
ncbi:unnamed protein product [uncultured bacterium]|nr:unnamed protein product [uncultured bacterium]